MRAALSEMTKNMGDSWGRTPERGHIHQLYCHPPFFKSRYRPVSTAAARRTRAGAACCRAAERCKGRRRRDEEGEEMGRLALRMELIYGSICVFEWNPCAGTSALKTNAVLCPSAARANPLPSAATGGDRNLFWCQDLISTRVRFGVEAKVKMPLLSDLWLLMLHEAQKHIPAPFSGRDS